MPKNTMPVLIRFSKTVENLRYHLISCQDVIKLNEGKQVTPTTQFFDDFNMNEDHDDDDEGVYMKVLVGDNQENQSEIDFYNKNLEERLADYKKFMQFANLKDIHPVRVLHCPQAHGVVITSEHGNSGFKQVGEYPTAVTADRQLVWQRQARNRA